MLASLLRRTVRIDLTDAPTESAPSPDGLNREAVIDRILTLNPSASAVFLDQFEDDALSQYLDHLSVAASPRGPQNRWVRDGRTPWACSAAACA
jgi:hypothetical protein